MTETAVVLDHLGRVHSARAATYGSGKLLAEAAALYLPQGLAPKACAGARDAAVAAGRARRSRWPGVCRS